MTPEDTVRAALVEAAWPRMRTLGEARSALDALVAERDALAARLRDAPLGGDGSHWAVCWRSHIDCAVARVDALAARLAEAEQARASLRLELDGLEFVRVKDNGYLIERAEAAEARVAALAEALRTAHEYIASRMIARHGQDAGGCLCAMCKSDRRELSSITAALAAADRPEGTTPDERDCDHKWRDYGFGSVCRDCGIAEEEETA